MIILLKPFLTVKDHSVSAETFTLLYDERLDLLKTNPQPSLSEIAKYYESEDYISHTDAKRGWFEKAYQIVKARALKSKVGLLNSQGLKGSLLDFGCGTGDFAISAKGDGWKVKAFEPSTTARERALAKGVDLVESTTSLPDQSQDAITLWHVLEHVHDVPAQLAEFKRLLKPGGTLIIAVPNFKSYDAKHYGEFWAAYDVPRHLWHFSIKAIGILASEAGLELVDVNPMLFDSFYVSLLSEKYRTGKMRLISAFLTGLKSNLNGRKTREFSSHIYVIKNR